ncbi:MAG TPA: FkbM family methyltransferase, partial [Lacipirellula sp.]
MSNTSQQIDIVDIDFAGVELRYVTPDPGDHIQRVLRSEGRVYEDSLLLDCFARELPRGAIIDVGANIGNHTVVFAKALGRKVVAIEPFPQAFAVLKQNVALNGLAERVTLVAAAAGRQRGRAELQVPPTGNWGRARITPAQDGEVEVIRLDDLRIEGRVALVKIDVEGMENEVLAGAQRLIKRFRPLIYVETQSSPQYALLKRRLNRLGYRMLRRFNHTPTYLFACCRSQQDEMAALLDKTDVLTRLEEVAAGQHDLARSLALLAANSVNRLPTDVEPCATSIASNTAVEFMTGLQEMHRMLHSQLSSLAKELGALSRSVSRPTDSLVKAIEEISGRLAAELQQSLKRALRKRIAARRRKPCSPDDREVQMPLKLGKARLKVRLSTATAPAGRANGAATVMLRAPGKWSGARENLAQANQARTASE